MVLIAYFCFAPQREQVFLQRKDFWLFLLYFFCCCESHSASVWLFVTPWTVAHQSLLSMEFSRQEYWSRLSFLSPGDFPDPGIQPGSPTSQADFLSSKPPQTRDFTHNWGLNEYLVKLLSHIWLFVPPWTGQGT